MSRARKDTGDWGEEQAAQHLLASGLKVLHRNVRTDAGEIDIIAADGDTFVFVEVKTFEHLNPGADPAENVHHAKQRRIGRAAGIYLSRFKREPFCRFDVITVVRAPQYRLQHFIGAFTL